GVRDRLGEPGDRRVQRRRETVPQTRAARDRVEDAREGDRARNGEDRGAAPCLVARCAHDGGEPGDGLLDIVGPVPVRDQGVEEAIHGALDHGGDERVAILEVDVEGAAGVAGARTDGVEARRVEAALRDLGEGRVEERVAGGRLGGGSRSGRAGHGLFLTYESVCGKSRLTYGVVCEERAMNPTIAPVRGLAIETARIGGVRL